MTSKRWRHYTKRLREELDDAILHAESVAMATDRTAAYGTVDGTLCADATEDRKAELVRANELLLDALHNLEKAENIIKRTSREIDWEPADCRAINTAVYRDIERG